MGVEHERSRIAEPRLENRPLGLLQGWIYGKRIAEATLKLQMSETGYQAALAAAARSNLPSLADFLN